VFADMIVDMIVDTIVDTTVEMAVEEGWEEVANVVVGSKSLLGVVVIGDGEVGYCVEVIVECAGYAAAVVVVFAVERGCVGDFAVVGVGVAALEAAAAAVVVEAAVDAAVVAVVD
jgi:hypothetical protein